MLENDISEITVKDSSLELEFLPFEIKTVRIVKKETE